MLRDHRLLLNCFLGSEGYLALSRSTAVFQYRYCNRTAWAQVA